MRYKEIEKNKEINAYLTKGNANLGQLGFTDHSQAHCVQVAHQAGKILKRFGYSEHEIELAKIAAESKELQDYKNLEDHGLLLKLPCKKGDYIYEICKEFSFSDMKFKKYYIVEREVVGINLFFCANKPVFTVTGKDVVGNMILRAFINKDFGKNVFLSREEAEKEMEEIKNNA